MVYGAVRNGGRDMTSTAEEGVELHLMATNVFSSVEGRVCHGVLLESADCVSWNKNSPKVSRSFI